MSAADDRVQAFAQALRTGEETPEQLWERLRALRPPALRMPGLPIDRQSPGYLKLVEDQADAWELKT